MMGFLERSVTVNFTNQTSRTLTLTSQSIENDSDYSYKLPPGTIEPGQTVQWKNAESDFVNCKGYASYKYPRIDNGEDGNLTVGWDNPISGSNTYNLSCNPNPLYGIMYSGGGGTEATINVTFVERDLSLTYHPLINGQYINGVLTNDDASSVGVTAEFGNTPSSPDDATAWAFVDLATGKDWTGQSSAVIKIKSGRTQRWLTAFSGDGNKIGLYPPGYADYPDQHWQATPSGTVFYLCNVNCGQYLACGGSGSPWVTSSNGTTGEEWFLWS